MNHSPRPGRLAIMLVAALSLAVAGCGSSSDSAGDAGDDAGTSTVADVGPLDTSDVAPTDTDGAAPGQPGDDGDGAGSGGECGGVTAAEVGSAAGAGDFDSVDDVSIDAETACLFTNSMSVYSISITTTPVADFLVGELVGSSPEEAATELGGFQENFLTDPTTTPTTIAGHPAVVVTGTTLTGGLAGYAGLLDGDTVYEVEADGAELAGDAAAMSALVTRVMELAVG